MTGDAGALPEPPSSDPTEARVERVAEGYIEALEAGEPIDRATFIGRFPEIAEALERRLALIDAFRALAGPPPEPEASGAIEVRCPHCEEPVTVDGSASGSAVCSSCGNGFRISGRADPFIAGGASSALGRYRLLEVVGRGAFGIVYRALDTELDRIVAVKVPRRSDWEDSEEETRRLFREARSTARLKHPGIVAVHDFGLEAGTPFIVCELIEGGTLSDRLKKGRLPLREAARLIVSVARALAHAHEQGVIHRDIKPGNILLDPSGSPHLGDFGLARRQEGEITVTLEGQILGTPAYMSPEQAAGRVDVDARSDIYSLGTVLYELITGQLPFSGGRSQVIFQVLHEEPRPPRSVQPLIPRDLETICLGAVEKDPRRRLSSAADLADELERYLAGRPIQLRPTGRWGKLTRWAARSPVIASLTGLVVVLLLALGVGSTIAAFSMRRAKQATQRALEESESRLVQLEVLQGIESSDSGDLPAAILRYTEALSRTRGPREEEALRTLIGTTLSHQPALRQIWLLPPRTRSLRFDPEGRLIAYAAGTEAVVLECSTGKRLRTFQMSRGACTAASFSRTGSRFATGDAGGVVTIWSLEDGAAVARARRAADIVDVLFLAGDERILIASKSGPVSIWNTTNGATERSVRLETSILQIATDTDGKRAVVLGSDGAARLWDLSTGDSRRVQGPSHMRSVDVAAASPRFLTHDLDHCTRVWSLVTGELIASTEVHASGLMHASISPDGTGVISAGFGMEGRLWSSGDGKPRSRPLEHGFRQDLSVFSADGLAGFVAALDGVVAVHDTRDGREMAPRLPHGRQLARLVPAPDGRQLLTLTQDGVARLWDMARAQPRESVMRHGQKVHDVSFSPDGSRLATASANGLGKIWGASRGERTAWLRAGGQVMSSVFSPRGDLVLTASSLGEARLWNADSGAGVGRPMPFEPRGPGANIQDACTAIFSPDGSMILTQGPAGTPRLWDTATQRLLHALTGHSSQIRAGSFSPDGRFLVTGGYDHTARVWDVASGKSLGEPLAHGHNVVAASFGPSGKLILTAGYDARARLWSFDGTAARHLRDIETTQRLNAASFSPDGRLVLTAGLDAAASVWDVETGALRARLVHRLALQDARWSADGSRIATASDDGTARVWDWSLGWPLTPALRHDAGVVRVRFDPRLDRVATASADGNAKLWTIIREDRPIEELLLLTQALSGRRIEPRGGIAYLTPAALKEVWDGLLRLRPDGFGVLPIEVLAWHYRSSRWCHVTRQWSGLLWHLERLTKLVPREPRLWLWRSHANRKLGRLAASGTDLAQAILRGASGLEAFSSELQAGEAEGADEAPGKVDADAAEPGS